MKATLLMPVLLALTVGAFGVSSFAETAKSAAPAADMKGPSKEQRESMAKAHEQMAACLRSSKSMKECHEAMHAACEKNGGDCPMGHMHGEHEHGGHGHEHEHGNDADD